MEISAVIPLGVIGTGNCMKKYRKKYRKKSCLVSSCRKYTVSTTGCCPDHSGRFHSLNYRMRQKYGAETLQPKIPKDPISESDDEVRTLQPKIPEALIFELSNVVRILQPRIYKALVSELDDEDLGLDLFG